MLRTRTFANENISDSGVVIRADEPTALSTRVTMIIAPPSIGAEPGGCLRGEGDVVMTCLMY